MAKKTKRVKLPGSVRKAAKGSKPLSASEKAQRAEITLRIRPRVSAKSLDRLVLALSKKPPGKRRYLTQEQLAAKYGASPKDIEKVAMFAQEHGLTVARIIQASRVIKLQGTVAALGKAFGAKLRKLTVAKKKFRVRDGGITIPAQLQGIVVGVHGLDNSTIAKPHRRLVSARTRRATARQMWATEVASLYKFPKRLDGSGQCIAIIEFNDTDDGGLSGPLTKTGYKSSDMDIFFRRNRLPTPPIVSIGVDGGSNMPGKGGDDDEVVLDIQVAGSIAPGATIAVYFAPNTTNGWIDVLKAAIHDTTLKPSVISISWGGSEEDANGNVSEQFMDGVNEAFRDAAALGITICVAAGDDGSADMERKDWDGKLHVDSPSSSPYALGCGGTELVAQKGKIITETVWNGGKKYGAGGGGVSNYYPLPAYQKASDVPVSPKKKVGRGVPDIAGNADPRSGYKIVLNGKANAVGGTSAVAPLIAGLMARINQSLTKKYGKTAGFINPLIYTPKGRSAFRDIARGNNDIYDKFEGQYTAKPRAWDACSGLGVPDGAKLLNFLTR